MNNENPNEVKLDNHCQVNECVGVIRYLGSENIKELIEKGQYVEAFIHTQLAVDKILVDKIVGVFDSDKSKMSVRKILKKDKTLTYKLIEWSFVLEVISKKEKSDILSFNDDRNRIIHGAMVNGGNLKSSKKLYEKESVS